jgi:hypothetical protein
LSRIDARGRVWYAYAHYGAAVAVGYCPGWSHITGRFLFQG